VIIFRGLVDTRLRKLEEGQADATLLALAGLKRLEKETVPTEILDAATFPPAPGQGAIALESRIGDTRVEKLLAAVDHRETTDAVNCERAFLAALDGSCRTPIAGYATCDGDILNFHGMILTPDGRTEHSIEVSGKRTEAEALGLKAGEKVRSAAGTGFFESWG